MKRDIIIIAAIHAHESLQQHKLRNGDYFISEEAHWHCAAANQCLAAIKALQSQKDKFLVKVLTTSPSSK